MAPVTMALLIAAQVLLLLVAARLGTHARTGFVYNVAKPVTTTVLFLLASAGLFALSREAADRLGQTWYLWAWSALLGYLALTRLVLPLWFRFRYGVVHEPVGRLASILMSLIFEARHQVVHLGFRPYPAVELVSQRWPLVSAPRRHNFRYTGCPYCAVLPALQGLELRSPHFAGLTESYLFVVGRQRLPYLMINTDNSAWPSWYQCVESPIHLTLDGVCADHAGHAP